MKIIINIYKLYLFNIYKFNFFKSINKGFISFKNNTFSYYIYNQLKDNTTTLIMLHRFS